MTKPVSNTFFVAFLNDGVSMEQEVRSLEKVINKAGVETFVSDADAITVLKNKGIPEDGKIRVYKITIEATEA